VAAEWAGAAGGLVSVFPVVMSAEQAASTESGAASVDRAGEDLAPLSPSSPLDGFSLSDISYLSD